MGVPSVCEVSVGSKKVLSLRVDNIDVTDNTGLATGESLSAQWVAASNPRRLEKDRDY